MKNEPKNPNDRQNKTADTKASKNDDKKFTSYDTTKKETSTPQQVREGRESTDEQQRQSKSGTASNKQSES